MLITFGTRIRDEVSSYETNRKSNDVTGDPSLSRNNNSVRIATVFPMDF